jgi:galactokinase
MNDRLTKSHRDRYEYDADYAGKKLIVERAAPRHFKGGLAFRVTPTDGGGAGYAFVKAEDVEPLIEAMRELKKLPCEHCNGEGFA